MKGIVVTTDNEVYIKEFSEPLYKSLGEVVDGNIELVHPEKLKRPYCMVVNEVGLLQGLPYNFYGGYMYGTSRHGNPIVGNIVILKEGLVRGEPDFISMTDEEAYKLLEEYISLLQFFKVTAPHLSTQRKKREEKMTMEKFYFTYGMEGYPFYGGWTEIEAEDYNTACNIFRAIHPDKIDGLLNCCSVYSEESFKKTVMGIKGSNLGYSCHEKITVSHTLCKRKEK